MLEEVIVELVGGCKRGAVHGRKLLQCLLRMSEILFDGSEAGIRQLVIPAAVAQRGGKERVLLHAVVPFIVKERIKRGAGVRLVGGRGFLARSLCDGRRECEQKKYGQDTASCGHAGACQKFLA